MPPATSDSSPSDTAGTRHDGEPGAGQEHNLSKAMLEMHMPFSDPSEMPILRLVAIRIQGLKNTRHSFLASLCRPYVDPEAKHAPLAELRYGSRLLFPRPGEPTTVREILRTAASFSADLARMDLAKEIAVQLEPSTQSNLNPTEDVDVVLKIKPAGRYFLKTSTSVGNSEGTASVQGKIRNLFGGAESLEGSAAVGTRTKHSYNVRLSVDLSLHTMPRLHHARTCG